MIDLWIWIAVWVVILIMCIVDLWKVESRLAEDRINKMFEYLKERKGEKMARYADIDDLIINKSHCDRDGSRFVYCDDIEPTADVVEVVRCENCKWQRKLLLKSGHYWYECLNGNDALGLDGEFCSDGERREENEP